MKTSTKIIIVLLAAALIGWWMFGGKKKNPLDEVEKDVFPVTVEQVTKRDITSEILISGSVKALEEATLFPRTDGKLLRNALKEGDPVKKGQTVSIIEKDEVGAVYEPVPVPSTITGIVGRVYLDAGAHVEKTTAVAFVVNQEKVRVLLDVPERYVGQVVKGQKSFFSIESLPGQKFEAKVDVISPVVDVNSRSVRVELLADNPKGIVKSGMFVKAGIVLAEKQQVNSVSLNSVYEDENGVKYVFVPNGDSSSRKDVTTGLSDVKYIEITGGLEKGETIIGFAYGLKEGSKISVSEK